MWKVISASKWLAYGAGAKISGRACLEAACASEGSLPWWAPLQLASSQSACYAGYKMTLQHKFKWSTNVTAKLCFLTSLPSTSTIVAGLRCSCRRVSVYVLCISNDSLSINRSGLDGSLAPQCCKRKKRNTKYNRSSLCATSRRRSRPLLALLILSYLLILAATTPLDASSLRAPIG